jgi:uncharacterized protein YceH (UPF0502 family)
MSTAPVPPAPAPILPLGLTERRVLGVLVEKAKTTPDAYPLSLNALVTGCNQKSNRDPILDLSETAVEDALLACQSRGLTVHITGGRVERWRHFLYEAWRVNKIELAILAELLLRGPQTEGELRARATRMEPIEDLDALRALCKPLAERKLVVYLTEQGKRGTTLTHGFHEPAELERIRKAHAGAVAASEAAPTETRPARLAPEPPETVAQIAALQKSVAELQTTVADLAAQLKALRQAAAPSAPAPPTAVSEAEKKTAEPGTVAP